MTGRCRLAVAAAVVMGGLGMAGAAPVSAQGSQQPAGGGQPMMQGEKPMTGEMHGKEHMQDRKMHRTGAQAQAGVSVRQTNEDTQTLNRQQLDRLQGGMGSSGSAPSGSGTSEGAPTRTQ